MKVLHISTGDSTGAGLCALRICESLQSVGIESRLLVRCNTIKHDSVRGVCCRTSCFIHDAFHKLLRLAHIYVCEEDKLIKKSIKNSSSYTRAITNLDISKNPWVQWADIIHLHWVDNFFDQKTFLEKIDKPIVWTLHDEGFFYGTSHYHDLFDLEDELEKKYYFLKERMFAQCKRLSIVFLSNYFERSFEKHPFVVGKRCYVINNSVDCSVFYRHDRELFRKEYGFTDKDIVLSFVAGRIDDVHKGLDKLLQAASIIKNYNIKILAIGGNPHSINDKAVVATGLVKDTNRLSGLLSSSDFFVMPSLQEAFSQAPLEAMACGVPAIVFPVSGTEELITKDNGVICNGFGAEDLVEGMKIAFARKYNNSAIREDVIQRFSPAVIAKKYLSVYECSLNQ